MGEAEAHRRGNRRHAIAGLLVEQRDLLVTGVVLLPLVVAMARSLLDDPIAPSGDVALMEVRVGDVGTATPLLGSYGRYGFNHPGPLLFYVLAIPYRLLGGRFAGMELGTLLLGALAVVAIAWVAVRRGGTPLLVWIGLLVLVLVRGVGPAQLADPWEPHGLLLPCAALILLAFDVAAGRLWTLPLVVATASLLAQAQATLLPFAAALGAVAVLGAVVTVVRDPARRATAWRVAGVVTLLTAVLWTPTVVEQLTREPGNLSAMAAALDRPEPALGVADGARLVAIQLGLDAPWLGWATPLDGVEPVVDPGAAPLVPIGAVALVLALALALWRRSTAGVLAATSFVAVIAGALALSRLLGPPYVWIPQWTRVLGFASWASVGWVAAASLPARARARLGPATVGALLVAVVGLSLLTTGEVASRDRVVDPLARTVEVLTDAARDDLEALDEPVLVTSTAAPEIVFGSDSVGRESLVLALEHQGVETVVDEDVADRFGPERADTGRVRAEARLALERDPVPDGYQVVAMADPLTTEDRVERRRLLASIGLDDDATLGDVVRAVSRDPSVRPVWERLRAYSDLPPFVLLVAELSD